MALTDYFRWGQQPTTNLDTAVGEEDAAEVDEPPDHRSQEHIPDQTETRSDLLETGFRKTIVRPQAAGRKESLLTKALQSPDEVVSREAHTVLDLSRRRSMVSNTSLASTAELTSDGGLTSPARTNTPSPPFPKSTYTSFAPYSLTAKAEVPSTNLVANAQPVGPISPEIAANISVSPTTSPPVIAQPKPRCIKFACGAKASVTKPLTPPTSEPTTLPADDPPKRKCMIQFTCANIAKTLATRPTSTDIPKVDASKISISTTPKSSEALKRTGARSPSVTRKSPRPSMPMRSHRDSSSSIRKTSQSPVAVRAKSKYIELDEKTIQSSEATRFHEFASEQIQDDDWIRKETDAPRERLTINDTLKKENAIRQLGNEAEEEALEDEEDNAAANDSDDENAFEEDEDESDRDSITGSDEEASDGNETDNEAGFADSDDESDGGEFEFWTPGPKFVAKEEIRHGPYRASAHRTASASSIDSLSHMSPPGDAKDARRPKRRPIKIRPGTPDLPDSTDFVCGTLDEDRPLEDAYVSCMEARRFAKHKRTPQDIDPSFPTSEPDDQEDEQALLDPANDSEENVWLHGKFEDSDDEPQGQRRSAFTRRKSPAPSPRRLRSPAPNGRRLHSPLPPARKLHSPPPARRLYSPPPPKTRLRSPPRRKLFGHSPSQTHSPPPARTIRSPAASPTLHSTSMAIPFAPLGSRPGLTHTKSLPRTPNAFCRRYRAAQLAATNGGNNTDEGRDGHVRRKAIDIVKGLERKRHYRKEKFYKGRSKNQPDRRPLPGQGAERMREVGLHMAGKSTGAQAPYMLSA